MARETATRGMVTSLQGGGDAAELEWVREDTRAERAVVVGVAFPPTAASPTVGAREWWRCALP